jgi:hypothetical protein
MERQQTAAVERGLLIRPFTLVVGEWAATMARTPWQALLEERVAVREMTK